MPGKKWGLILTPLLALAIVCQGCGTGHPYTPSHDLGVEQIRQILHKHCCEATTDEEDLALTTGKEREFVQAIIDLKKANRPPKADNWRVKADSQITILEEDSNHAIARLNYVTSFDPQPESMLFRFEWVNGRWLIANHSDKDGAWWSEQHDESSNATNPVDSHSLDSLRLHSALSEPIQTFQLPSGSIMSSLLPFKGIVWTSTTSSSGEWLGLTSSVTGQELWRQQYSTSPVSARPLESGEVAAYSPAQGLDIYQGDSPNATLRVAPMGPGYVRAGNQGQILYLVPWSDKDAYSYYFSLTRNKGSTTPEKVLTVSPYRGFSAAAARDTVLLTCPGIRLTKGTEQLWEVKTSDCPTSQGISDDGTIAYAVFAGPGDSEILRVYGAKGQQLWEQRLASATENFVFAAGGKRFWLRLHDSNNRPLLRLASADGSAVREWSFSTDADNVWSTSNAGDQALLIVNGDIVVLSDQGQVQLRFTLRNGRPWLSDKEQRVYLVDRFSNQTTVSTYQIASTSSH